MSDEPAPLRVGLLGGSFDPVHIGHLILAEEARGQLDLSLVYFVPAADPPHKRDRRLAPVEHRIRMLEMAIEGNDSFAISRVDVDRPGPHYTVDLIQLVRRQLPDGAELFFLMGFDSLRDLPTWREPARLIATAHLVALTRPDIPIDWEQLEAKLPGVRERVRILDMPELEIASHDLRQRVSEGRSIRYQVPDSVREYIEEQGLYSGTSKLQNTSPG